MHHEREAVDALDPCAGAGGNDRLTTIDRAPRAAAKLDAAGLSRRQRLRDDQQFARRAASHDRQIASHALVNPPPKADHAQDGERRENQPLQPYRKIRGGKTQESDHQRSRTDEHQVELRIDEGELRSQEDGAHRDPRPPLHIRCLRCLRCCASMLFYRFIASKKSALVLVSFILSSKNSIAASSSMGCRSLRRIHILDSSDGSVMSSSLRVPERLMLIDGKVRFSEMRRSKWISELPVPLNSSKMTSSIFEPVSTSAVARMVRLPPSSMLRAAPKKRFGRCSALASTPPVSTLPELGTTVL